MAPLLRENLVLDKDRTVTYGVIGHYALTRA
jgi:hypothetical protein